MIDKTLLNAIVCPVCSESQLIQESPNELLCGACGQNFIIKNSIPILLKNPENTLRDIQKNLKERPDWYKKDQVKYTDKGPYKHHLNKRMEYLLNVFNRYPFSSPLILDAGCGDGINLRQLVAIKNSTVFGIDYNLNRLIKAKANCNNQAFLILGSLLETVFRKDYFNIILCNHVIEHIEDDLAVLLSFNRILKPNGILILGVPNEGAILWKLNYRVIQPHIIKTTDHIHFYTVKDIKKLLNDSNFILEETKYMGWGVPHTVIDAKLRQYKWIDDLFEIIGRKLCKSQATSLYFVCRKALNQ